MFKPAGVPRNQIDEVLLTVDELEAIRLAHLENYYQQAIARQMGVSRPTAGRILESAHRKIAEALVHGKSLRIDGGTYVSDPRDPDRCPHCGSPRGQGRRSAADDCPDCAHGAGLSLIHI